MNLLDLAPEPLAVPKPTPEVKAAEKDMRNFVDRLRSSVEFMNANHAPLDEKSTEALNTKLQGLRENLFRLAPNLHQDFRTFPKVYRHGIQETKDGYSLFAATPQVSMSGLRETADRLDMLVMPVGFLADAALPRNWEDRNALESFCAHASKIGLDVYVIAPVAAYSINAHLDHEGSAQVYSKAYQSAFMAVLLQLPILRALREQIKALKADLSEFKRSTEQQMKLIHEQITALGAEQMRQRAEMAQLKIELDEANRRSLASLDPLAFAIPHGSQLSSEFPAFLGPCWGPELPEIVTTLYGVTEDQKRRKLLTGQLMIWRK